MVPDNDDLVSVEERRAAFPEFQSNRHVAQVLLPDQIPLHVQTVETEGTKIDVDMFTIGDGRGGGPGVGAVGPLVGALFPGGPLPKDLPRPAVQRQQVELHHLGRFDLALCLRRVFPVGGNGSGHEYRLIPNDRGRVALAGDGHFPANVPILGPFHRRVTLGRNSRSLRSPPLVPIGLVARRGLLHSQPQTDRNTSNDYSGDPFHQASSSECPSFRCFPTTCGANQYTLDNPSCRWL